MHITTKATSTRRQVDVNPLTGRTCKHMKHSKSECWILHPELKPANGATHRSRNRDSSDTDDGQRDRKRFKQESAQVAVFPPSAFPAEVIAISHTAMAMTPSPNHWLVDSGCSTHMCNNLSLLSNLRDSETPLEIACGGNTLTCQQSGDLHGYIIQNGKQIRIELTNVLYVRHLARNLLSIHSFAIDGINISFQGNTCELSKQGKRLIQINASNGIYPLTIDCSTPSLTSISEVISTTNSSALVASIPLSQWHARMGHLNYADLLKLPQMVDGMIVSTAEKPPCRACLLGKATVLPHPATGHHTDARLQLIHSDLCGPMPASARDGFKYFISFIDDFTKFAS